MFCCYYKNSVQLICTVEQLTINKFKKIKSFSNLIFSLGKNGNFFSQNIRHEVYAEMNQTSGELNVNSFMFFILKNFLFYIKD